MSIYNTPFLYPEKPQVVRMGMRTAYGSDSANGGNAANGATQLPAEIDNITQNMIEQYAPVVAGLIKGKSPEESVGIIKARLKWLQQFKNVPVVGLLVQQRIAEYQGRLPALEEQARISRIKRYLVLAAYGFAVIAVSGIALSFYRKALR